MSYFGAKAWLLRGAHRIEFVSPDDQKLSVDDFFHLMRIFGGTTEEAKRTIKHVLGSLFDLTDLKLVTFDQNGNTLRLIELESVRSLLCFDREGNILVSSSGAIQALRQGENVARKDWHNDDCIKLMRDLRFPAAGELWRFEKNGQSRKYDFSGPDLLSDDWYICGDSRPNLVISYEKDGFGAESKE